MVSDIDWVDGWEVRAGPDGGFGVYDSHGLVDGPHGTRTEAIAAALRLPKRLVEKAEIAMIKRKIAETAERAEPKPAKAP